MLQHFIIEGKYLGSAQREMVYVHAQKQLPRSYAFFCPVCAEVWARCPVEVIEGQSESFAIWVRACQRHFDHAYAVPGSIIMDWDQAFTQSLPDEVVKWEFDRHMEYVSKGE